MSPESLSKRPSLPEAQSHHPGAPEPVDGVSMGGFGQEWPPVGWGWTLLGVSSPQVGTCLGMSTLTGTYTLEGSFPLTPAAPSLSIWAAFSHARGCMPAPRGHVRHNTSSGARAPRQTLVLDFCRTRGLDSERDVCDLHSLMPSAPGKRSAAHQARSTPFLNQAGVAAHRIRSAPVGSTIGVCASACPHARRCKSERAKSRTPQPHPATGTGLALIGEALPPQQADPWA